MKKNTEHLHNTLMERIASEDINMKAETPDIKSETTEKPIYIPDDNEVIPDLQPLAPKKTKPKISITISSEPMEVGDSGIALPITKRVHRGRSKAKKK